MLAHATRGDLPRCVIEYLQRNVRKRLGWEPKHVLDHQSGIVQECGIQVRGGVEPSMFWAAVPQHA